MPGRWKVVAMAAKLPGQGKAGALCGSVEDILRDIWQVCVALPSVVLLDRRTESSGSAADAVCQPARRGGRVCCYKAAVFHACMMTLLDPCPLVWVRDRNDGTLTVLA